MFGEFFALLLSESDSRFVNHTATQITNENRFLYPNYLLPINLDVKNYPPRQSWNISKENKDILDNCYQDKWIVVPTHWYDTGLEKTGLPCLGIRLHCNNLNDLNLSYCLWWLKSHIFAQRPWPLRTAEIKNMIKNNHTYKVELENLLVDGNYSNWKFLSYSRNILKNGRPDLDHFVKFRYYWLRKSASKNIHPQWLSLDIGELIHRPNAYDQKIESALGLENSLDLNRINLYKEQNLVLLKEKLNLDYEDLQGTDWLDNLSTYCSIAMQQN